MDPPSKDRRRNIESPPLNKDPPSHSAQIYQPSISTNRKRLDPDEQCNIPKSSSQADYNNHASISTISTAVKGRMESYKDNKRISKPRDSNVQYLHTTASVNLNKTTVKHDLDTKLDARTNVQQTPNRLNRTKNAKSVGKVMNKQSISPTHPKSPTESNPTISNTLSPTEGIIHQNSGNMILSAKNEKNLTTSIVSEHFAMNDSKPVDQKKELDSDLPTSIQCSSPMPKSTASNTILSCNDSSALPTNNNKLKFNDIETNQKMMLDKMLLSTATALLPPNSPPSSSPTRVTTCPEDVGSPTMAISTSSGIQHEVTNDNVRKDISTSSAIRKVGSIESVPQVADLNINLISFSTGGNDIPVVQREVENNKDVCKAHDSSNDCKSTNIPFDNSQHFILNDQKSESIQANASNINKDSKTIENKFTTQEENSSETNPSVPMKMKLTEDGTDEPSYNNVGRFNIASLLSSTNQTSDHEDDLTYLAISSIHQHMSSKHSIRNVIANTSNIIDLTTFHDESPTPVTYMNIVDEEVSLSVKESNNIFENPSRFADMMGISRITSNLATLMVALDPTNSGDQSKAKHIHPDVMQPTKVRSERTNMYEEKKSNRPLRGTSMAKLEGLTPLTTMKIEMEPKFDSSPTLMDCTDKHENEKPSSTTALTVHRTEPNPCSMSDKCSNCFPVPCVELSGSIDVSTLDFGRDEGDSVELIAIEDILMDRYLPDYCSSPPPDCTGDLTSAMYENGKSRGYLIQSDPVTKGLGEKSPKSSVRSQFGEKSPKSSIRTQSNRNSGDKSLQSSRRESPKSFRNWNTSSNTSDSKRGRSKANSSEQGTPLAANNQIESNLQRERKNLDSSSNGVLVPLSYPRAFIASIQSADWCEVNGSNSIEVHSEYFSGRSSCSSSRYPTTYEKSRQSSSESRDLPSVDDYERRKRIMKSKNRQMRSASNCSKVTFDNVITELSLEPLDSQETSDLAYDMLCNQTNIGQSLANHLFGR